MMGIRFLSTRVAALTVMLLASNQAVAEERIALVIGNGSYDKAIGALANTTNDVRLMAKTLRQLNFEVIERVDVNQKGMKRAINAFGEKLQSAGKNAVGLFYYAGHGVQVGGANYLIPIEVEIDDEADVDVEAVSANAVQQQMAYAGNRLNIIILDACRNNPFKRGFRSISRGLARMQAAMGTLVAYATAPGDVAADGADVNSPYTKALAKALLTPGLTVERVFKQVRNQVLAATNNKQVPWESSSLTGADYYFRGGRETQQPWRVGAPARRPQSSTDKETVFWLSIKDSNRASDYAAYLEKFPVGVYSPLARSRMALLREKKTAALTPSDRPGVYTIRRSKAELAKALGALRKPNGSFRVYFGPGEAAPGREAQKALKALAVWLKRNPNTELDIEGHTDAGEGGGLSGSLALSERRALAAKRYLESLGIKYHRMTVISFGAERPYTHGEDEVSVAKNRRVTAVLTKR